ncbi:helix-turn-helix transcriptional regulator [Acidobacteria bacterium AB60]|nr:helix-turn-helix transcriptional regulator [Acidobacteria bacterium AB60]
MSTSERPPLPPLVVEEIEELLHRVDRRHWPTITEMRGKKFYAPDEPLPPRKPQQLIQRILWYASILFGTEADQYDQFRSDPNYPIWLLRLEERVTARVMNALDKLEAGDPKSQITGYHGLSWSDIGRPLQTALWEIRTQYEQGTAPSQRQASTAQPQQHVVASTTPKAEEVLRETPRALPETVADQLKRLRSECHLTVEQMAIALEVQPRSISKHLAGQTVPRARHIVAYEELFSQRLGKTVTLRIPDKKSV